MTAENFPFSPRKRILFFAIVCLTPIVFFALLEALLHTFQYGGDLALVTRKVVGGKEFFCINRSVAKRYFAHTGVAVPEPADDTFEIQKPEKTVRIFCLGESTMAGFPYEFNATAPRFLLDRLKTAFPDINFEVVNVGTAAVGSYVVLDFLKELVDYDPDLFIIYVGHNEFYGIYQPGSSFKSLGGHGLTTLAIRMLKFKTYLLLRDMIALISQKASSSQSGKGEMLMEQMIGQQKIVYGSATYQIAEENYGRNVQSMIDHSREAGVPILFSSLVSNVRSLPPFEAITSEQLTTDDRVAFATFLSVGDASVDRGNFKEAIGSYEKAIELDSFNATATYKLAGVLLKIGQYGNAKEYFLRAKDLDGLRFRASESLQQDLVGLCRTNNIAIAPVNSAFEAKSPNGIVGAELLTEHVHPNVDGYFLMAKTWFKTIAEQGLLSRGQTGHPHQELSDSAYRQLAPVTEFDRAVGDIRINMLMHRPPFAGPDLHYEFVPGNEVERIAFEYVRQRIFWSDARYKLAEYYANQKKYFLARQECLALAKVVPTAYQPVMQMADYYLLEGKTEEAETEYLNSIKREDNPFARLKIAHLRLERNRADEALVNLKKVMELSTTTRFTLKKDMQIFTRYLLGVSYAQLGKFDIAQENINEALRLDQNHVPSLDLLAQIQSLQNKK